MFVYGIWVVVGVFAGGTHRNVAVFVRDDVGVITEDHWHVDGVHTTQNGGLAFDAHSGVSAPEGFEVGETGDSGGHDYGSGADGAVRT